MGKKFKKVKKRPIKKRLDLITQTHTTAAEIGFRSGIKHQLKKQNIAVDNVDAVAQNTYHKPFMALTEKQMKKVLQKSRR